MELMQMCKRLLVREPFWGLFLLGVNKRYSTEVETLAVAKAGLQMELLINKEFWDSHAEPQQMALLLHELHHICFDHVLMAQDFSDRTLFNIATDLEVNCYIEDLPDGHLDVKLFNFEARKGSKYYYEELQKIMSQGNSGNGSGNGKGQGNLIGDQKLVDDHSPWKDFKDISSAEKELIKNQLDSQLKETADQLGGKLPGNLPSALKEYIEDLLKEKDRIYNWKAHFRRFLGTQLDLNFKKTYQRLSKRFPNTPGVKFRKKVSILVGIDTSGSVSNQELADFFSEISHISKAGAHVHVIECDADISCEWDFKDLKHVEISGRGGTDFTPVIEYYRKHLKDYTTLVFFTDGYASIKELNVPQNNMLWVITSNGARQDYPGKVIYIPENH